MMKEISINAPIKEIIRLKALGYTIVFVMKGVK